jgi:hypothetical protein
MGLSQRFDTSRDDPTGLAKHRQFVDALRRSPMCDSTASNASRFAWLSETMANLMGSFSWIADGRN